MGVNLKDILLKDDISIPELKGKRIVVDGNNILYQFLSTVRQPDGTPLMDSDGNVTSHLTGLFHRTAKLMHYGIRLVFVFDGKPPELKRAESERRAGLKAKAREKYEQAKKEGDAARMKKFSMRTSRLTRDMIDEAADLLDAMGVPVVFAPSEGEAQAALMVKKGEVFAEVSQDYDCLLFGVPRMVQNLTISERKKRKDRLSYERVSPRMIELEPNLKHMGITRDQLIVLGMLVGTDYNVGGVKGIGPKKALDLVKKHGDDFTALFKEAGWDDFFDYSWKEVMRLFREMPVDEGYSLDWKSPDRKRIVEVLCDRHGFSLQRVNDTLDKLDKAQSELSQKGLGEFV